MTLQMFVLKALPIPNPHLQAVSTSCCAPFQKAQSGPGSKLSVESQAPGNPRWLANGL